MRIPPDAARTIGLAKAIGEHAMKLLEDNETVEKLAEEAEVATGRWRDEGLTNVHVTLLLAMIVGHMAERMARKHPQGIPTGPDTAQAIGLLLGSVGAEIAEGTKALYDDDGEPRPTVEDVGHG